MRFNLYSATCVLMASIGQTVLANETAESMVVDWNAEYELA